jgi:hypothetical protein
MTYLPRMGLGLARFKFLSHFFLISKLGRGDL